MFGEGKIENFEDILDTKLSPYLSSVYVLTLFLLSSNNKYTYTSQCLPILARQHLRLPKLLPHVRLLRSRPPPRQMGLLARRRAEMGAEVCRCGDCGGTGTDLGQALKAGVARAVDHEVVPCESVSRAFSSSEA